MLSASALHQRASFVFTFDCPLHTVKIKPKKLDRRENMSSSSSSCASLGSIDEVSLKANGGTVKFLCSYGGKILPRYPDGKLRYIGGETRVLAVDRSVSFSELKAKVGELCGWGMVSIRCQLPTEDLDALVSITSDEDLANLIEEYDLANRDRIAPSKIRAFLHPAPVSPSKFPKNSKGKSMARPPVPCYHGYGQGNQGNQHLVHHGTAWH